MTNDEIRNSYFSFLGDKAFPCVAAKASLSREQVKCLVVGDMREDKNDAAIIRFLYEFVDSYRTATQPFHSAAIIFEGPSDVDEQLFDQLIWKRLDRLRTLDRTNYKHDPRVDDDPESSLYSFSVKEEAFFIIGLHPGSSRRARRFQYPTLVFNPHAEFERLRETKKYDHIKRTVRQRDKIFSGSVNPMLADFGERSEVHQYSGIHYQSDWKCPMKKYE